MKKPFFRFRDRFQFLDETRIRLPHKNEKACAFTHGKVCFYEVVLFSDHRFPIHPFIMELLHRLNIALGQFMRNSWQTVISFMEIFLIVNDRDMFRMDKFVHLYHLKESKQFGYYELVP